MLNHYIKMAKRYDNQVAINSMIESEKIADIRKWCKETNTDTTGCRTKYDYALNLLHNVG